MFCFTHNAFLAKSVKRVNKLNMFNVTVCTVVYSARLKSYFLRYNFLIIKFL